MALTILTLNVNGLRDNAKRAGLLRWLRALPSVPDVVCLQETHCTSLAEGQIWFLSSGFECSVSPGTARSAGCIVLFRPPLSLEASRTDSDGRFLRLDFSFRAARFRVVAFTPLILTLSEMFFSLMLPIILTLALLLSWLVISIPSLIGLRTVVVQ